VETLSWFPAEDLPQERQRLRQHRFKCLPGIAGSLKRSDAQFEYLRQQRRELSKVPKSDFCGIASSML
jgi:hypothetical protein